MKKNLFLLFSIYFFVIQPLVIGVLREQTNFFRLGAINLLAIIIITLLSGSKKEEKKEEHHHHEKKPEIVNEPKSSFQEHLRAVVKERKKRSELTFPTVISLLVVAFVFFIFPYTTIAFEVRIFCSIIIGFIIFVFLTLSFKHRISKRFWKLFGTKLYILLILASIVWIAYNYYQIHQDFNATIQDYLAQNFLGQERIPTNGFVFTGEGTVLGTGLGATTGIEESLSDVFSGTETPTPIQEATWTVIWNSPQTDTPTVAASVVGNQKLLDAVTYLLKKYSIPLITKKDISFTYVSMSNEYYNQRRTAYANKLIGKSTNPSKYIICDSYIVMKWILEKRDVPYTSSTVLSKYRAEAIKRNALNGCEKGKIVTDKTL